MSDDRPGVSFVVPVLNGERWLRAVLVAILAQDDARPFEVIVVDDGSTDRSRAIVDDFVTDGRVRAIVGLGKGAAAAINLGIRHAKHPIVCQIDQDVIVEPGWLAHVTDALVRQGAAECMGRYQTAADAGIWARVAGLDLQQRYRSLQGSGVDHVCTGNTAYRVDAVGRVGFFDESLGYGYDNDMSYRLAEAGYLLVFCPAARSVHAWREGGRRYLAQQYGVGYGRLDLIAKHPKRVGGDDTSGPLMITHAALMLIALSSLSVAALAAFAGATWRPLAVVAVFVIAVLGLERLIAAARAARAFGNPIAWWFVPIHLLRDVAWSAAIVVWIARRLLRRPTRPAYSMRSAS